MAKDTEMDQVGLGDLSDVLHNQGVADLAWLDVDVEEYRKFEALPKQNLDMIPELQQAMVWDGKDDRVPSIIPLRPHTVVNRNPLDIHDAPVRSASSVTNRLAAYVMAGLSDRDIQRRLTSEFSPQQLQSVSAEALSVLNERGLLGNVYVNASHFPRCAQEGPHREFVAKHGKRALFVLSKDNCSGCVHNKGGSCGSFKKRLVSEVPYDSKLAAHYSPQLSTEKRLGEDDVRAFVAGDVKDRLRVAFLRPVVARNPDGVQKIWTQDKPKVPELSEQDIQSFVDRHAAVHDAEPMPSPMYLVASRRVQHGQADRSSLLASSDPGIRHLAKEYGILGHTYLDGDALGGVEATWKFQKASKTVPDFILFRNLASMEKNTPEFATLCRLTSIVPKRLELGRYSLSSAIGRAHAQGRISEEEASALSANADSISAEHMASVIAQLNLYVPQAVPRDVSVQTAAAVFHYGSTAPQDGHVRTVNPDEIRRSVGQMMNTGLSGGRLASAVQSRYSRNDLAQIGSEASSRVLANDGIQGSYFVDPTVYPDYGKSCHTGSELLRKKSVPNVLTGSSCTGCRYQTHPGWCSKYAKTLIRQVPEVVREEIRAKRSLPVVAGGSAAAPVRNPVEEFGLTAELSVEIGRPKQAGLEITITSKSVDG